MFRMIALLAIAACSRLITQPPPSASLQSGFTGQLIVAAQRYKWSKELVKEPQFGGPHPLEHIGCQNLFLVDLSSGRLTQITFGTSFDHSVSQPKWMPDGNRVVYVRDLADRKCELLLWNAITSKTETLVKLNFAISVIQIAKQSSGKIAIRTEDQKSYVVTVDTRQSIALPKSESMALSPDGFRVYLDHQNFGEIIDLRDMKSTRVQQVVHGAAWLSNEKLVGFVYKGDDEYTDAWVVYLNSSGHLLSKRKFISQATEESGNLRPHFDNARLNAVPNRPDLIIVEEWHKTTMPYLRYARLNLKTLQYKEIQEGTCCGLSPSGSMIAITTEHYEGPYKRGGAELGPITLVDTNTWKVITKLPSTLTHFESGDWRPVVRK